MKEVKSTDARIDRIVFLGTGSAVPVPGQRNMSSLVIVLTSGAAMMVDCGEGTQHHIRVCSAVRASKLEVILLTHLHGDHCFGLFGLLHTIAMEGRKAPLLLIGPAGLRHMVDTVMSYSGGWDPEGSYRLDYLEVDPCGPSREQLMGESGGFEPDFCRKCPPVELGTHAGIKLTAVPMVHSLPDWGYVFSEQERPGTLNVDKAISLGVPKGPLLAKLKAGMRVQLPDGTEVNPEDVIGPTIPGRVVAVLQDTSDASSAIESCKSATCVIHEATFEESMKDEAIAKGHSTSAMAAEFVNECRAHQLVLTHFSARYSASSSDSQCADPAESLGDEARQVIGPGGPSVVVARDFMVLRGDRFEPDPVLALKRSAWDRSGGRAQKSVSPAPEACAH